MKLFFADRIMKTIFSVEGNIGSGKSTTLDNFQKYVEEKELKSKIEIFKEPIELFQKIGDSSINPLELFYKDRKQTFFLQNHILDVLRDRVEEILASSKEIILTERSLDSTEIFISANQKFLKREENVFLLEKLKKIRARYFKCQYSSNAVFFLDVKIPNLLARIQKRGRIEETIPQFYLESVDFEYRKYLQKVSQFIPVKITSTENSFKICEELEKFILETHHV